MNDFAYVVLLVGAHVSNCLSVKAIIKHLDDLDKIRTIIRDNYGIEVEDLSSCFNDSFLRFDNITDNRDISLIVKRVDIVK